MYEKQTALESMRRALVQLDARELRGPATHLQRAIDDLTGEPVPRTEAEVEMVLSSPEGQALQKRLAWRNGGVGDGT